jgi:glutamyl-tRNA synthetase
MLHIGGVRTALFSWLYARRHGGQFILRVEDTDRERSTDEAVQVILDGMAWLGLNADEGPFYQTKRYDRYHEVIGQFLQAGHAYHCYCSKAELDAMRADQMARKEKPRYDGRCRHRTEPLEGVTPVVRFRNPDEGQVVVNDVVHGPIVFDSQELDDLIILRSDGNPTYNFCVAVDDWDMGITHVIRGDDHINNTPRQINMLRAMGATPPVYAHLPMILGPDGTKLSKRHGAVSVLEYKNAGFLPEALLNYLGRLGWSHGDQELFSIEELIQFFDLDAVNKSASALNPDKLAWTNQQHMMRRSGAELAPRLSAVLAEREIAVESVDLVAVADCLKERAKTLVDMADGAMFFFADPTGYDPKAAAKNLNAETAPVLDEARAALAALEGPWTAAAVHGVLEALVAKLGVGLGKVAQPLRVAVAGSGVSPPIDATLAILGAEATLRRIDRALEHARAN